MTTMELANVDEDWTSTSLIDISWPEDLFNERKNEQESSEKSEEADIHLPPRRRPFRRPRAGRACGSCHSRRIRCDAGSHGLPCTNCTAHSATCFIPLKKKKKASDNVKLAISENSRKHRGRYTTSKPWLETTPISTSNASSDSISISASDPKSSPNAEITSNLIIDLYASIALQNNATCISRLHKHPQPSSKIITEKFAKNFSSESLSPSTGERIESKGLWEMDLGLDFCEEGEWMLNREEGKMDVDGEWEGKRDECKWLDKVVVGTKVLVPMGRNVEDWFI